MRARRDHVEGEELPAATATHTKYKARWHIRSAKHEFLSFSEILGRGRHSPKCQLVTLRRPKHGARHDAVGHSPALGQFTALEVAYPIVHAIPLHWQQEVSGFITRLGSFNVR